MRRYVAVTLHLTMLHIREQKLHPCYTSTVRKRQQNQAINAEKPPFRSVFLTKLVRVGRLELPASCSQMCVVTFNRYSTALFGPFLCLGSSSLTLFCPACFKKPFRLLGFVWDWILCIKRCSARFNGGDDRTITSEEGRRNCVA